MADLVLLDGVVMPVAAARVSPFDRGFVFGDGIYDVVRLERGVPLFLDRHLDRLGRGLATVGIPSPGDLAAGCRALLAASPVAEGSLYFQVTRGAGPRTHLPSPQMKPTWLIAPNAQPPLRAGSRPLRAVTFADPRWARCDVKTTSLMGTVLGKLAARDAGCDEVVFVAPDGGLREGGSTSLFVRVEDRLVTHPLDGRILPSVTRERVLAACARLGLAVEERAPGLETLRHWQEAFLCGTLTAVQPLVALDDVPIPAGACTERLAAALTAEQEALVGAAALPGAG